MILVFNKPYGVLSQFTSDGSSNIPLSEFGFPADVYPIGRLDADSEGILLLSDEAKWNASLLHPKQHVEKSYLALVERLPSEELLVKLQRGVTLNDGITKPCKVRLLNPQPDIPSRIPPVRVRKSVQDYWIELRIREGRNRQVRRMCAAIGHPVLRLI
ncbi:MAG: pseudouridine synthase, partial [Candidatus Kapabacteria bacterium]|nr:pseudouridine synthase [Candidatus Kapabacteria bacterium]